MSAPPQAAVGAAGSWDTITTALEQAVGPGRPSGAWTKYCCPAHEGDGRGHHPSLGVKYSQTEHRTVVRCFAGCDNERVLESVGLQVRDMFDRPLPRRERGLAPRTRPRQVSRADRALDAAGLPLVQPKKKDLGRQLSPFRHVATYPYARPDGTVAGEVIRKEASFERGRDKEFHQRRWTRDGMEAGGFEPIPFQLPRVLDAIEAGRTVFIVEGEKDVLAAESAGLTATCNAGGASSWSTEHAQWLKGAATVVIVADRDTAGYRRADRVMSSLTGLVERVRVVQALTGKDLSDHLACGHEVRELEPVPHLDPQTPSATASAASAPSSPATPAPSLGGTSVPEHQLVPQLHDQPADQTPDIDHAGSQLVMFWQLLMRQMMTMAQRQAEQRRRLQEHLANQAEDQRREAEARLAAERAAVEARLRKLREGGLENASRTEIAEAVKDAAAWAGDSQIAKAALQELSTHVEQRYGVRIDAATGQVTTSAAPELADALTAAETERAAAARLKQAQDRMVEIVARDAALDQSVKEELYAEIEKWRAHPSAKQLDALSAKLTDKGVSAQVTTRIRFVAHYLGVPGQVVPVDELVGAGSLSPSTELRKLGTALVDPGEEAKPRVDQLLTSYQDMLRTGRPTASVRERLAQAMAVLTPEDQQAVRDRGNAIRTTPGGKFTALWPDHVDRDELATTVRMYATLAPQAEATAGKASDLDDATAAGLAKAAARHRRGIERAIKDGKGLHELEKGQLKAVLRDVEAGKTSTPEMLWADDRSAAAVDADRAAKIAQDTTHAHRRQLEQILETNTAPAGTVRRSRDAVTRVMDAHTQLAAGRASLPDYERGGTDRQLDAHLTAAGVPEPLRNKVRAHLNYAAGEAATAGKQANRIAESWAERHEALAIERTPQKIAYDSPQRRAGLARDLKAAGMDDEQIAERMAADAGHAKPASEAVKRAPGEVRKPRTTSQGTGLHRVHHRGRGKGPGLGR